MAKREIRISIFYSDLFVFDFMRAKSRLDGILKSANDFYGKYKLRIDPFPFSYNYTLYKDAFVLSATTGIRPDYGMDQLAATMRANADLGKKLHAEMDDPATTGDRKDEIRKELKKLNQRDQSLIWDGFNSNGEHDFRMALGERFAKNATLTKYARNWQEAPRLVVIFCEFISLAQKSKLNNDTAGVFINALDAAKIRAYRQHKKPIPKFPSPYVMINAEDASWHVLAHELAHGNGHVHPTDKYDEGTAGYYDGPHESIYNYFSSSLPPAQVILEDPDLKSLEQAFFVRE